MAFWNLVILVLRGLWNAINYREHFADPQFTLHPKYWLPRTIMTPGTLTPGHVESYSMPCLLPRCLLVAIYSTSLSNWNLLKVRMLNDRPVWLKFAQLLHRAINLFLVPIVPANISEMAIRVIRGILLFNPEQRLKLNVIAEKKHEWFKVNALNTTSWK